MNNLTRHGIIGAWFGVLYSLIGRLMEIKWYFTIGGLSIFTIGMIISHWNVKEKKE